MPWEWWTDNVGLPVDAASAMLFGALGVAVAFIGPRTVQTAAFSLFAIAFGMNRTFINLWYDEHVPWVTRDFVYYFDAATGLVAAAALIWLTFVFPTRATRSRRVLATVIGFLGGAVLVDAATLAFDWDHVVARSARPDTESGIASLVLHTIAYNVRIGAAAAFVAVQALRWHAMAPRHEASAKIAAFALALPVAVVTGFAFVASASRSLGVEEQWMLSGMTFVPAIALIWIFSQTDASRARFTRNLVLSLCGVTLAVGAFVWIAAWNGVDASVTQNVGIFGVARLIGFSMLAYAVLRYQMLDIHVRLKMGIRQSTVAAVFIAGFFVVSEITSGLLSERMGLVAGVLTTGVLVFLIAPLQKLGESVAGIAIPDARPLSERPADERERMYHSMAEAAWRDGNLTRSEARVLETARDQLGMAQARALAIEANVRG